MQQDCSGGPAAKQTRRPGVLRELRRMCGAQSARVRQSTDGLGSLAGGRVRSEEALERREDRDGGTAKVEGVRAELG